MSNDSSADKWMAPSPLGPCACSQLRRTTRKVSSLYDDLLNASGLTNSQYALLVNVARQGAISRTALAEKLGMDRTTLTRNLKPLEGEKLVVSAKSDDRRERLLKLSPAGRQKLRRSYDQWETAQQLFASHLGSKNLRQLRTILQAAEEAVEKAVQGIHP